MREIKFRAWLKNEKKMVNVRTIDLYTGVIGYRYYGTSHFTNFEDIELMQYRGFKDINGVEIYEEDIVKCYYDLYIVKFEDGCFKFCPICQTCENKVAYIFVDEVLESCCEVIGNIYDNPNLLQK